MTTWGRPSKGDRDVFAPSFSPPVAELIRDRADALGIANSDYLAAILSHQFGSPWTAPAPVREAGGLPQMIADHNLPDAAGTLNTKATGNRVPIMVRPSRPVGAIIRDEHMKTRIPMGRIIGQVVDEYHRGEQPTPTLVEVARHIA